MSPSGQADAVLPPPSVDRTLNRACRAEARGRAAQAERWFRQALGYARRRRDRASVLAACRALTAHYARRDNWRAIAAVTTDLARELPDAGSRLEVSAVAVDAHILLCEFEAAELLLSAVLAACQITEEPLPPEAATRFAAVRFWQGRFDEASAYVPQLEQTEALWMRGLIGWAARDRDAIRYAARALAGETAASIGASFRSAALLTLDASLGGDRQDTRGRVRALDASLATLPSPSARRMGRIVMGEALSAVGLVDQAETALGPAAAWVRAPVLDALLYWRVRGACSRGGAASVVDRHVAAAGALGVNRWGLGTRHMHLWHALPTVLELVQEADDELSALRASSAWLRRQSGAEAAGFSALDGAILAADGAVGPVSADLIRTAERPAVHHRLGSVVVTVPVRHGGVIIGIVLARGARDREATMEQAALAVAALCAPALQGRLDVLAVERRGTSLAGEILGQSPAMVDLRDAIAKAASTPFPVLIEGESGTGKELVARAIHRLSARRDRRLCPVNCAALSDELVEAELFGHARGAFTGAIGPRAGLFEDAHGGTLFLDEVGELSSRAQAKLLRALQEREVRRVGENAPRPIDVRVVSATNRTLAEAVTRGAFREDLLFRLAVVRIRMPALRDRLEDLPALTQTIWRRVARETGTAAALGPGALAALSGHAWPGNVRELQNVVAALGVVAPARGRVTERHVRQVLDEGRPSVVSKAVSLDEARRMCERRTVADALARHGGRRAPAARELGLSRQGLSKAIRRLGLATREAPAGVA